jgi:hypothetical protein
VHVDVDEAGYQPPPTEVEAIGRGVVVAAAYGGDPPG